MRIDFKILHITFKILQGLAPSYLVSLLPASLYQLRRNDNGILLAVRQMEWMVSPVWWVQQQAKVETYAFANFISAWFGTTKPDFGK